MPEITNNCLAGGNFGIAETIYLQFCQDSSVWYESQDTSFMTLEGGYEYNAEEEIRGGSVRTSTRNTSFTESYEISFKETGTISPFRAKLLEYKRMLTDNDWVALTNGGINLKKVTHFKGGKRTEIWKNLTFQDANINDIAEENKNEWTLTVFANQKSFAYNTTLIDTLPAKYSASLSTSKFETTPKYEITGTTATVTFTDSFTVVDTEEYLTDPHRFELVKITSDGTSTVEKSTIGTTPELTYATNTITGFATTPVTLQKGETLVLFGYRGTTTQVQLWAYEFI